MGGRQGHGLVVVAAVPRSKAATDDRLGLFRVETTGNDQGRVLRGVVLAAKVMGVVHSEVA